MRYSERLWVPWWWWPPGLALAALIALEVNQGVRALPNWVAFAVLLPVATAVLLLFNSAGLVKWTQQLSSSSLNVWLAERAADWDRLMHTPPARVFEVLKKLLSGE